MKFKPGDKVKIISKSMGRKFSAIPYREGVITFVSPLQNGLKKYVINHDWFLECDLVSFDVIKKFSNEEFEI